MGSVYTQVYKYTVGFKDAPSPLGIAVVASVVTRVAYTVQLISFKRPLMFYISFTIRSKTRHSTAISAYFGQSYELYVMLMAIALAAPCWHSKIFGYVVATERNTVPIKIFVH